MWRAATRRRRSARLAGKSFTAIRLSSLNYNSPNGADRILNDRRVERAVRNLPDWNSPERQRCRLNCLDCPPNTNKLHQHRAAIVCNHRQACSGHAGRARSSAPQRSRKRRPGRTSDGFCRAWLMMKGNCSQVDQMGCCPGKPKRSGQSSNDKLRIEMA